MKKKLIKTSWLLFNICMSNVLNVFTCSSLSSSPKTKSPFKAEWINLLKSTPSLQKISPPRSGHVSFTLESSSHSSPSHEKVNDIYIFGGYVEEEESNGNVHRYASNDLWKLCSDSGWIQVSQNGDIPNVRLASASAVVDNHKVLLFGGWDPETSGTGGVMLDTTHELDTNTNTWKHLKDTSIPDGPTSRHVAISLLDHVLIHNHRCIDHLLIYDIKQKKITKQPVSGKNDNNDIPSSRGLHTACMLDDNKTIVFFGGAAQNGEMSNEVFLLNIETWEWKKIALDDNKNNCPSPRASPCMCALDDKNLIIYGGAEYVTKEDGSKKLHGHGDLWLLRITNKEKGLAAWELLIPEDNNNQDKKDDDNNDIPHGRNAATLSRVRKQTIFNILRKDGNIDDDEDENDFYFILHGGWRPFQKTFNDMFALKIKKG